MFRLAHRYLSSTDRVSEIAFAVYMVIIINGYVALSNLNTGFFYIVGVNVGACFGWGFIDGFIYFVSSSITRNSNRQLVDKLKKKPRSVPEADVNQALDDTIFEALDQPGKDAVLKDFTQHLPTVHAESDKVITRDEALGWLSIVLIYMSVGVALALPFLVIPDKLVAWFVSNGLGTIWLFWFGVQMGKSIGKYRLGLGLVMAGLGLMFLGLSYLVWT
jgi:VIT1/CCC1 family predicted Fe2+/Mn2+ transporter